MNDIREFIGALQAGVLPGWAHERSTAIAQHYAAFSAYADRSTVPIYGTNTLVGHLDATARAEGFEFESYLIENHSIGSEPWLDRSACRAITLAKIFSLKADGVILGGESYKAILAAFEDPGFHPQIPATASYSCGDVIPAAHWAKAVLARQTDQPPLQRGEALGLINGVFVHLGLAAHLIVELEPVLKRLQLTLLASLKALGVGAEHFREPGKPRTRHAQGFIAFFDKKLSAHSAMAHQYPVTLRCVTEIAGNVYDAVERLAQAIDDRLALPSGNPLFCPKQQLHVPSGSFLAPGVAIANSALIEALLMLAWSSVERSKFLLSGKVPGTAPDAATAARPLGLIQWPKLAQAKLEYARQRFSTRIFGSGGSTSYGTEDFWTHGSSLACETRELAGLVEEILAIEWACACRIGELGDAGENIAGTGVSFKGHGRTIADALAQWRTLDVGADDLPSPVP
ncbi:aromatic amino acid lyase [Erythrobacter sp. EC-HK427]|uniref:aromatic amino acid lyase n=1 Tax=Erythrobacter sp. EC-HK427 TaxID=2038396 RepID=UPI0012594BE1|nr:aromatic amino acid lyase [Erythrobacter sp. EC-HK427]VVT12213.1 conserved hypothetical protein [Erythrobacter sp. EC-HK427]